MLSERVAESMRAGLDDGLAVQRVLSDARRLDPALLGVAVLNEQGRALASVGEHAALWQDYLNRLQAAGFEGESGRAPGTVLPGALVRGGVCGSGHSH